ncbi:hypothetical protein [Aquabacterium humicola]|uniref:hypothetical protein n=1 Tax=Aquabacterium humicola TaxID=3237377 RepID=UPI0025438068|nr:hypothetical protein [Rubrivivax pictus]
MVNHWPELAMLGLGVGAALRIWTGPLAGAALTAFLVGGGVAVFAWPGIDAPGTMGAGMIAGASALADSMAALRAGRRRARAGVWPPADLSAWPAGISNTD